MFNSDFFKQNRQNLRRSFADNPLFVFTANGLLQRSGDTTFPFRQDSSFWYLTGVAEADILLVLEGDNEYLILPKRSETFETFNGKIDFDSLAEKSAITQIYEYEEGLKKLKSAVLKYKKIVTFTPLDGYIQGAGFYSNPAKKTLMDIILGIVPSVEAIDARAQLAAQRMIKQPVEVKSIKKAISISISGFWKIKQNLDSYQTESEIVAALSTEFISHGAQGHAYDPIAASGKNACTLHYLPRNAFLKKGELVLIDAGAEYNNYAADITRTYAASAPTKRQTEVYDAVMDIRSYALSLLKPGISLKEYERSVKNYSLNTIKKLNLEHENPCMYYPHSTSHFLGLDVHDAGNYEAELAPNMVLTVEPGIYIEEESIGIRIEDNILITADGYENLSEQLPRELI